MQRAFTPTCITHTIDYDDIAEQRLWRAVIATAIREWLQGPLSQKTAAEQYLLYNEEDYQTVCNSAGIDPGMLRSRLQQMRAR